MISRTRAAALVLVPLLVLTAACGSKGTGDSAPDDSSGTSTGGSSSSAASCTYTEDGTGTGDVKLPPAKADKQDSKVTIATTAGDIPVQLDGKLAPCTVNSFLSLAKQGFFDDIICHRLTTSGIFVLQCGDPSATGNPMSDGAGGPGYTFDDEIVQNDPRIAPCKDQDGRQVCTYGPGTLAMANAGPGTNGSQFFLVYDDSPLEAAYTVFGQMDAAGLKVVKKVAAAGVGTPGAGGPDDGTPKTKVVIKSVS